MKPSQKVHILLGVLFILFLVSYKFSLYQDTSQLWYLAQDGATPAQKILTYLFMMIGVLPTMLIILVTTIFCSTSYPDGIVHIACFGYPFSLSTSIGFAVYAVSSAICVTALWKIISRISSSNTNRTE